MSRASEEHIRYQEQQGIIAEPSPMTRAQYDYILELLQTSILGDIQKQDVINCTENNITIDHASNIIRELLQLQRNPLDRIRDGETLSWNERKKAIRKATENPNT
jgi:hypothetical protein